MRSKSPPSLTLFCARFFLIHTAPVWPLVGKTATKLPQHILSDHVSAFSCSRVKKRKGLSHMQGDESTKSTSHKATDDASHHPQPGPATGSRGLSDTYVYNAQNMKPKHMKTHHTMTQDTIDCAYSCFLSLFFFFSLLFVAFSMKLCCCLYTLEDITGEAHSV